MSPNSSLPNFKGRLALQQRVLPSYRAAFFDLLAKAAEGGLSVFAGNPLPVEGISTGGHLYHSQHAPAKNWHFGDPSAKIYLCWQRGVIQWLEDWGPDALILEANPRCLSNHLAIRWMHRRGRPVLGWGLGAPSLGGVLAPLRRQSRRAYLYSLDGLIAYSQRGADEYKALGLPSERVFVATNAAMPRPEQSPPARPDRLDGPPVVLFVGRLQARKRLDILLRASAALPGDLQPRVVIVGGGPARAEFEALSREIYPNAEFVGGKYGDEAKPYFEAADLFALPGTGGLAVQQAMSHGLPVIVAKGDGTQDDLVRPGNGWQVQPGDQDTFANALQEALSDVPRLRRMGAESYRIVVEEINLEEMVSAFVEALMIVRRD